MSTKSPAAWSGAQEQLSTAGPSQRLDEQAVRGRLRQWVLERSKAGRRDLSDQTPILETGMLTSLDIVELVLFIEELRGEEIETDAIEPEVFGSVDAMMDGFFAGRT